MKTFVFAVLTACLAIVLSAAGAAAQPFDHLKCHKVKDSYKIKGTFDPSPALQSDFEDQGCTIGKAKLFCVPTEKNNVQTVPMPLFPGLGGQDLTNDFICYRAKCPTLPPDKVVTDQFIDRALTKMKTQLFCTPAYKGPPPTTTTTVPTTYPACSSATVQQCDGTCPVGDMCEPIGGSCVCIAANGPCASVGVPPECVGECGPTQACVVDLVAGACICAP